MKESNNGDSKKTRYLDSELEEFKQIILAKLEKAKVDFDLLTEAYSNNSEHGTNDTSPTFKVLEEGQQVLSKEENSRLAARQKRFIINLENALIRIENKTYGMCRVTGKLISKERLKAVPHATLSIEAKNEMAKSTPIN
jgi:DnaK suppressor protein